MRVLVTGAGGFLGQRLLAVLRAEGHEPLATTGNHAVARASDTYFLSDPLDPLAYQHLVAEHQIEAVINALAAGVNPADRDVSQLMRANTIFPTELALAAKAAGAQAFVQIGSSAEYAPVAKSTALGEDAPLIQDKLYGATKAAGSLALSAAAAELGMDCAILRLFNIFGPGEKSYRLFPSLVTRLSRAEPVALSAGTQVRDFLFVDDACRAITRMLGALQTKTSAAGTYNLASGMALSVRDFALAIAAETGANPQLLKFGELPMRPDDLPYLVADTSRLDSLIGPAATTALGESIAISLAALKRCEGS